MSETMQSETMQSVMAVPDKTAARIAGVTMRQLRYWEQIQLVVPSVRRKLGDRRTVEVLRLPGSS
jgi:hypothetical protein